MKVHRSSQNRKLIITVSSLLLSAAVVAVVFFSAHYIRNMNQARLEGGSESEDRNYHVVVMGKSENASFLNLVYEGACNIAEEYKAKVELYVPQSQALDTSFGELLDYASFTNADGVIAFIDSEETDFEPPCRYDGTSIPLVTIGNFVPTVPQISYIGSNYSEIGRVIGRETVSVLGNKGNVYIIDSQGSATPNHSNLSNSLLNVLKLYPNINTTVLDKSVSENTVDMARYLILSEDESSLLFICLNESDMIRACQTVIDLNASGRTKLIGLGSNEIIQMYFERGIITELIDVNTIKIGEAAMKELFEYRTKGYANSYITADIEVKKYEAQ